MTLFRKYLLGIFPFFLCKLAYSQSALQANAGNDTTVCPNATITLHSTVTGGSAPYTYSWLPTAGLNDPTIANPQVTITGSITYTLVVHDAKDSIVVVDAVSIFLDNYAQMGAGIDTGYCLGQGGSPTIGALANYTNPYTFSWTPIDNLSDPASPHPIATPTVTTTFTVQITSPKCGTKTDEVTVFVFDLVADAGTSVTIVEGTTVTLHAQPSDTLAYHYWWSPSGGNSGVPMLYQNSPNPDVAPSDTTTFVVSIFNKYGCLSYDSVTVYVIPSEKPVFYTTFTPNGDGTNDTWYIGNCGKFPNNKLEIYNRYGQLIFSKSPYNNDWGGRYFGNDLPSGTYYYIFDTHTSLGKFSGSVTIIR